MRATVLQVAVASLVVMSPAPALGATVTITFATSQSQTPTDTIRLGGRTIAAGDSVRGPILVAAGDLRVQGTVVGTAVSLLGDIIVEDGGRITGDAIAVLGSVQGAAGSVAGTGRSFEGSFRWLRDVEEAPPVTRDGTGHALSLALGWLVVMLLVGIGVLILASNYLDGVTDVLEQSFWRSFLVGLAAEVAVVPLMVLIVAALAVTLVGILLVPFAVVAYVLAIAGLVTLGFLAVAQLVGGSIGRRSAVPSRGQALRALILGVSIFMGGWVIAAAFQWVQFLSGFIRLAAFAVCYVAATAGLGAAVLSRGGTNRDVTTPQPEPSGEVPSWQTPTPVTGVAAARRPVKAS